MTKIVLQDTNSGHNLQTINDNFRKIEDEFNKKVLYRDNPSGEPNEMESDLDMNSHRIYNLPEPVFDHEAARYKDLKDTVSKADNILNQTIDAKNKSEDARDRAIEAELAAKASEIASSNNVDLSIEIAEAASKGDYHYFKTKAEAISAGIPEGSFAQVFVDETYFNSNVLYQMNGGTLEFLFDFDSLRKELTDPDKGVAMVARGVVAVDSIADLLALPTEQKKEGLRYLVKGYNTGSDEGGGEFYWDESRASENDGGLVLNGFVRIPSAYLTPEMFKTYEGDDWTQALVNMFKACTDMPIGSGISANEINSKLNSNNYKVVRLTKLYRHTKPIHIPPNVKIEQCVSGMFSKNRGTIGLFYDPIESELDTYAVAPFLYRKDNDGTYSLDTSPYTLPSGGDFDRGDYIQTGRRIFIEGLSVTTKQGVTLGFRFVGFAGSIANYINVGTNDGSNSRIPKVAVLTNACWNSVFTKPTTLSSNQGWVNWGSSGGMTVSNPYINFGYSEQDVSEITPVYAPINHTEKGAIGVVNRGDAEWDQPITENWYFNYVATSYLRVIHPHIEGSRTRNCFYFIGSDGTSGVAADITLKPGLSVDITNANSSIIYLKDCDINSAIYLRGRPLGGASPVVRGENSSACVHLDISRNHYFINSAKWGDLNLIRNMTNSWGDTTVYVDPIGGDDEFIGMRESKPLKSLKFAVILCDLIGADRIHIVNDVTYSEIVDIPKNVTFTGKAIIGVGGGILRVSGLDTNVQFNNTKLSHESASILYLNNLTTGKFVFNCEIECTAAYIQARDITDIDITINSNNLSTQILVYGDASYPQAVGLNINTTSTLADPLTAGGVFIKYSNLITG